MKLLIIIPTYNEAENIKALIKAVFVVVPPETDVLVVDDNSPDGTAKIVEQLAADYRERLYILNRSEKQGLAAAYLAGFGWGLSRSYGVFLEMDADFSHDPKYIPAMSAEIAACDVVIGSRNIKGGGVEGWPLLRRMVSKGGSLYSRFILGCPVKDLTGGFNMWTKNTLERIGLDAIISKGYSFQIEMKYRAYSAGCSIREIPIRFSDRKRGASKMTKNIFLEAFINVWKIKKAVKKESGIEQLLKFFVTGGLGTITNLMIFFLCADIFNLPEIPVSVACFFAAATQNYYVNHKWSFKSRMVNEQVSVGRWLKFICASLFGLAINIGVMKTILFHFVLPYKFIAQAGGILSGMLVNFTMSRLLVFRKERC